MIFIENKKVLIAEIGILLVAMFWGLGFISAKFILDDIDPFTFLAYRYAFAFICMSIVGFKSIRYINIKTLKAGTVIGSLMFIGNMFQTIGLQYTTPGKQTFITSVYTVLVPILSWIFFKEKISKKMIFVAFIAFVGIGLLTLNDNLTIGLGDGLTFVFAISFSLHVILVGRYMKDIEPFSFAIVQIGICAFFHILGGLIFGKGGSLINLSQVSILGMVQLVLLNTVLAFLIQNTAQKIVPTNHIAILMSTEVVFGTIFTIIFTGEVFTMRMVFGLFLMGIALFTSNCSCKDFEIKTQESKKGTV